MSKDILPEMENDNMKGTLKDLLLKVKQKETAPISPLLDQFFLTVKDGGDREHGWHPSYVSNGICPRLEVIVTARKDLVPPGKSVEPSLMRIFWFGQAIHELYQNRVFGPMGALYGHWIKLDTGEVSLGHHPDPSKPYEYRYREPTVHDPEHNIVGHTDGLLVLPDGPALLELKTINSRSFEFLTAPREAHVRQANLYMHCKFRHLDYPMPKRTVILYVNKNTSEEKEFWVEKDDSKLQPMLQVIKTVERSNLTKSLPERITACKTATSATSKKCSMCDACFSCNSGKQGYDQLLRYGV